MNTLAVAQYNGVVPVEYLKSFFDIRPSNEFLNSDALLVWNNEDWNYRRMTDAMKVLDKPSFVFQEGSNLEGVKYYSLKDTEIHDADYMLWSEYDRKIAMDFGVKREQTIVVGCPLIVNLPVKSPKIGRVVFAPHHIDLFNEWNIENAQETRWIWDTLQSRHDISPAMKALRREHALDYQGEVIYTDRVYKGEDHIKQTLDLLKDTDLVITQDSGTFALIATCMDIPVIHVVNKKHFTRAHSHPWVIPIYDKDKLNDMIDEVLGNRNINLAERIKCFNLFYKPDCHERIKNHIMEAINKTKGIVNDSPSVFFAR